MAEGFGWLAIFRGPESVVGLGGAVAGADERRHRQFVVWRRGRPIDLVVGAGGLECREIVGRKPQGNPIAFAFGGVENELRDDVEWIRRGDHAGVGERFANERRHAPQLTLGVSQAEGETLRGRRLPDPPVRPHAGLNGFVRFHVGDCGDAYRSRGLRLRQAGFRHWRSRCCGCPPRPPGSTAR